MRPDRTTRTEADASRWARAHLLEPDPDTAPMDERDAAWDRAADACRTGQPFRGWDALIADLREVTG